MEMSNFDTIEIKNPREILLELFVCIVFSVATERVFLEQWSVAHCLFYFFKLHIFGKSVTFIQDRSSVVYLLLLLVSLS